MILRRLESDRVQSAVFRGKAYVVGGVRLLLLLLEGSARGLRWTFAELLPWTSAVDGFAVGVEPFADGEQALLLGGRNRAVSFRSDV